MDDTLTSAAPVPIPAARWDSLLTPQPRPRRPIIVVLGMHRSGTSLCAHVLSALGIDMSDEIGLHPSNAKGHWERREIVRFHDRILDCFNRGFYTPYHDFSLPVAWWADPRVVEVRREMIGFLAERIGEAPFGFKDPRAARLLPVWHQIFSELDLEPKIVFCLRNPGQVARSLHQRDGLNDDTGELRWFAYVIDFFRHSKNCDIRILEYETWFDDPQQNLSTLRNFIDPSWLQRGLDTDQLLAGIVDDRLRHDDREHRRARQPLVRSLYALARRADRDPAARQQILTMAAQYVAFDQMQTGFQRAFERNLEEAQRVPQLEQKIDELTKSIAERDGAVAEANAQAAANAARARESAARENTAIARLDAQLAQAERQRVEMQLSAAEAVHAELNRIRESLAAARAEAGQRRAEAEAAAQELIELTEALIPTERLVDEIRADAEWKVAAPEERVDPPREAHVVTGRDAQLAQAHRELADLQEALAASERLAGEFRATAERELAAVVASVAELTARLTESAAERDATAAREGAALAEIERQRRSIDDLARQRDMAQLAAARAAQEDIGRLREALAAAERDGREQAAAAEREAAEKIADVTARLTERTREAAEAQARSEALYAELLAANAERRNGTGLVARLTRSALRRRVGAAVRAGDRASRAGDMAAAALHYRRALERSPGLATIWVQLAHVLKEQGNYDEAERAYRHSLALDGSVADTHLQLGHLLKLLSRWAEAAGAYARALELDPGLRHVARELDALGPRLVEAGDRARDARDWPAAARYYRSALDCQPSLAGIWVQLGHALKEQGDYTAAETAYGRSLALDETNADTHLQFARALKLQCRWGEAADAYARALQIDPGLDPALHELDRLCPHLVREGDAAADARNWPAAAWYYRRALDRQPEMATVWLQLGHALEQQGDDAGAEAAVERALALDGAPAEALLRLGSLLRRQGRLSSAIDAYAAALRRDSGLIAAREALQGLLREAALKSDTLVAGAAAARRCARTGLDVIWLGVIDWHYRIQRPQHLAANLADLGARVFYVSLVFEAPDDNGRFRVIESPHPGVFEIRMRFPGNGSENLYRGLSTRAVSELQLGLDELIAVLGIGSPIVVVEHPAWQPVACGVPGGTVIYDCLDLATGFSTASKSTAAYEATMLATADLVVAASRPLIGHIGTQRSGVLIRNAADVEFFAQGFTDRPSGEKPVIGYFGAIAEWFNIDWIESCAAARPDWDFRLVGRTDGCNIARAAKLPNVRFLGEKPYRELPLFLREVDVAVIPFRMIELIRCTNPVKLYEYMAAGKAVVAAPMPEVIELTDLAYIAEDAGSFAEGIARALSEDGMELRLRRLAWAREHTWASRARQLKEAIEASLPLVSVVILTYNNWEYTSACLSSLLHCSDYANLEIIVVDNASSDQTRDNLRALERQDERIRVVLNDANLGFAAGNNIGLRLARGEFVILLNNDTVVTRGWVRDLIRPMQLDPGIGMAGPLTNNIGNEQKVKAGYGKTEGMPGWARRFVRDRLRRTFEAGNLAFFCVAIRRSVLDDVGLLDEAYGIGFFEDDDYCRRARQAGYKLVIADDVFVHHHLSASFAPRGSEANDALMARNKAIFEERWGPWQPHRYRDEPGFG